MPKIPDAAPRAGPIPEENLLEGRGRIHRVGGKHSGGGEEHQLLCERKGDEEDYMLMLSLSNGQFIFSE